MTGSAARLGGSPGPVFVFRIKQGGVEQVKQFKTYGEQVELLRQRGMRVNDPEHAEMLLARLNYYRLSGYWYPMRRFSQGDGTALDEFVDGASFDLVVALYGFDEQLRHSVFTELDRVELAIRTKLGHELGRLDPLIYLDPQRLNARARQRNKDGRSVHEVWLRKYQSALKRRRRTSSPTTNQNMAGLYPSGRPSKSWTGECCHTCTACRPISCANGLPNPAT